MMIKNDQMVQLQVETQALLDETVKKSGWCGRFGRSLKLRDTNKSIRICLAANLILDELERELDSYHCFGAKEDGEQVDTYDEVTKRKYKNEWMSAIQSELNSLEYHDT